MIGENMKNAEFRDHRRKTILRFKEILAANEPGHCDEQGLPSYTIANPLMRWLTWTRVRVILAAIAKREHMKNTLDFGCGYGVFTEYLLQHSDHTLAFDLMIDELKPIGDKLGWKNISYASDLKVLAGKNGSFDLILATEVLEHVDDLEGMLRLFRDLLEPGGRLLISGPTENFLYKIGRKLAGFSGEYHVRNIYTILDAANKVFRPRKVATIFPILTFYEVYECVKE